MVRLATPSFLRRRRRIRQQRGSPCNNEDDETVINSTAIRSEDWSSTTGWRREFFDTFEVQEQQPVKTSGRDMKGTARSSGSSGASLEMYLEQNQAPETPVERRIRGSSCTKETTVDNHKSHRDSVEREVADLLATSMKKLGGTDNGDEVDLAATAVKSWNPFD